MLTAKYLYVGYKRQHRLEQDQVKKCTCAFSVWSDHFSAALKHLTAVTGNRTAVADNSYRSVDLHDVSALNSQGDLLWRPRGFAGRLAW